MIDKENVEKLKTDIENYVKTKGWSGFFGLLATITPTAVYQEDVEKYNAMQKPPIPVEIEHTNPSRTVNETITDASIYAAEHIPAVQEDLADHGNNVVSTDSIGQSQQKKKVLDNKAFPSVTSTPIEIPARPNPWGDASTVVPGEVKDKLMR